MQPTTLTKPVMDVAAPKSPAVAPASAFRPAPSAPQAAQPVSQAEPLSVRPAPLAPQQPASVASLTDEHIKASTVGRPAAVKRPTSRTPVALITVTAFVMLVLSVLAVTVYMTSQTA